MNAESEKATRTGLARPIDRGRLSHDGGRIASHTVVGMVESVDVRPDWACPRCAGRLECADEHYRCEACGASWPIVDGVTHFVSEAPYRGEIAEPTLQTILEATNTRHWKDVFRASSDPDVARSFTFIANLNRTSWQYFLPSGKGRSALCVGEDMGATADALSRNYASVVALEPVLTRVQFMQRRFSQDQMDKVRIVRASFPDVPFAKQSFDLVVFNGVIEWLPSGHPSENPTTVQVAGLRKAFELLRPGGYIYIGIENRWCYKYFLGASDPHVGVRWVTIAPRRVANWLMRRAKAERYQNYLYGSRGYRQLLRSAGFSETQVFIAKESYNRPEFIVPVRGAPSRYFFRNMDGRSQRTHRRFVQWVAERLGILGELQYAFILIASKP
jgi:SAM-dependent methyltransferase